MGETIDSLAPVSRFIRVDFPAFGAPTIATKPQRVALSQWWEVEHHDLALGCDGAEFRILDAGAGAVVASRWPVDSAATAALVSRFYASLNSAGDPVAALASARQQLRRETRFAHPYYWSAFQIYE